MDLVGRSGQTEVCAVRGKVCMWGWGDERDGGGEDECGAAVSTEHKVQASAASTFFFWPVLLPFVYQPDCTRSQGKVRNRPAC